MKRPIKVGKRPINEGKRPIKAKVLVGVSVGSSMGCFRAPPPWHDGPMSLGIWRVTPYCHANVAQLWSSLSKTRDVASLWRYGVCLSRAEGHPAVTDPRFPPTPFPPNKGIPILPSRSCRSLKGQHGYWQQDPQL